MKYKAAICDDSEADRNYIRDMAERWAEKGGHVLDTDVFPSAESFLFHYEDHKDYDILLLDIEMDGMDGISLAKKLRQDNDYEIEFRDVSFRYPGAVMRETAWRFPAGKPRKLPLHGLFTRMRRF